MSSIFLDTDIILDVLAERHPYYQDAAHLMTLIEQSHITGCTSSLIFANLFYILRKLKSKKFAISHLRKLRSFLTVLPVDDRCIDMALYSAFNDFEDSIQYQTAKQHQFKYIITRNTADFKAADSSIITVCTANDYLLLWKKNTVKTIKPVSKSIRKPQK